jgi:DNA-binding response OmpR family regulator
MANLQFDQVDIVLVDPDRGSRDGIRNMLYNNGFRDLRFGSNMEDLREQFKLATPDLLICEAELPDGDFARMISSLRHHEFGNNPFLPVIATTWNPTGDLVKSIIECGVDDLLPKPISTAHLLNRIKTMVNARKPFVVTSDYIGPQRRNREDTKDEEKTVVEVPNTLRAKATGEEEAASVQNAIRKAIAAVNEQKLERHAVQIAELTKTILAAYEAGAVDGRVFDDLDKLYFVAGDTSRRMTGTQYGHVSDLCESLIKVTASIRDEKFSPASKDLQLLKPLSQAIAGAFAEDESTADLARQISASVSGD